jgi:uncharacterized protein YndB with AHSA1/START domain
MVLGAKREFTMEAGSTVHATLVFERSIPATAERVFAAYTDIAERMVWGAPSENTALIYDKADFREGGEDVFRCGAKSNPNIEGHTRYLDVVPDSRIVSSETIMMDGRRLCASLTTFELNPDGEQTKLKSTIQLASFVGQGMLEGHTNGTNASLDNLVRYFRAQTNLEK